MTQPPAAPSPAQQLIAALRQQGVSMSEIAAECDRDSSLLYQVVSGKRPGKPAADVAGSRPDRARFAAARTAEDPDR